MPAAALPTTAYCLKCKSAQPVVDGKIVTSGKRARMAAKCQKCNTGVSVFLKK